MDLSSQLLTDKYVCIRSIPKLPVYSCEVRRNVEHRLLLPEHRTDHTE